VAEVAASYTGHYLKPVLTPRLAKRRSA